jgi:hypothetical protein
VRITFSTLRFAFFALCAAGLLGLPAHSQERRNTLEREHSLAPERTSETEHTQASGQAGQHPTSAVHDWTEHHMLYPRYGDMNRLIAVQNDPRAIQSWQAGFRRDYRRWRGERGFRSLHHNRPGFHRDWAVTLGAGSVAPAMFPSKWTFDTNETVTGPSDTGSCLTDYVVFPVNIAAGAGQPNIVGLNNLYSGTAGASGNGVCNRAAPPVTDDGVSATTYFSYAVVADDGVVATSPTTSMDGTKIAFVEGTTTAAHFHVLAWNAGDGNNDTVSRQDPVTNALSINTFTGSTPTAGTATDITLLSTDTLSSPFVEYTTDVAYVGDNAGNLYKIKNVFCPTWAPCGGAAPSLDGTWGAAGVLATGCGGPLTGVVVDGAAGNIFVGCSNGTLYGFTHAGGAVTGSPLTVGDGNVTNGGIVDTPLLDVVRGFVYVASVNATAPVVVQASVADLTVNSTANLFTAPMNFNMHAPAFNNAYFSGPAADALLYEYSSDDGTVPATNLSAGGAEIVVWGIGFTGGTMNAGTPSTTTNALPFGIGQFEISPLTEFLDGAGADRLFAGALGDVGGNIVSYHLNDLVTNPGPPAGFPINSGIQSNNSEGAGTSGIIIDNTSNGVGQADSLYFGVLGTAATVNPNFDSAVKLTQVDFQ